MVDRFNQTQLEGEMFVMRECLIEGDLSGASLDEFMINRTKYLATVHHADPNVYAIASLIDAILHAPDDSEFNFWFEYDLFCQTNMWFLMSLIYSLNGKSAWIIYPTWTTPAARWRGFGPATVEDMKKWYGHKAPCTQTDLDLAAKLWNAYKNYNLVELEYLSGIRSQCFPYLEEVCFAHIDRIGLDGGMGRPEKRILSILREFPSADFNLLFREFTRWEGAYGFGDVQFYHIYEKMPGKDRG